MCEYEWGSGGNVQSGRHYLHVTIIEASKAFPGTQTATIKQGMLLSATREPNGAVIPGVRDAAIFTSSAPIRANTSALVKGFVLQVNFEAIDARAHKDHVIALLKAAASRL